MSGGFSPIEAPSLLNILLSHHQGQVVVFVQDIPLVIAEVIGGAALGGVDVGEVVKVKAFPLQYGTVDILLTGRIDRLQNATVFTKGIVNIPHEVVAVTVLPVIMTGPAFVGAEFFVGPAPYGSLALQACPLFHGLLVLVKEALAAPESLPHRKQAAFCQGGLPL